MDIFVLVEPSVVLDGDDSQPTGRDAVTDATEDAQDNNTKRQMPNSPPRPNFLTNRPKRFRGSPSQISHKKSPTTSNRISDTEDEDECSRKVHLSTPSTSQRIFRARERRRNQQEKRIQTVHVHSVTRTTAALQRAESHLQSKVTKAYRFDERIAMVKEKRVFLDAERRVTLQTTSEQRTERARKRAELNIQARQDIARHIDRIAKVRQRRSNLESERAETLQNEMAARTRRATMRAEQNLKSKQKRARFEEKAARAKTRRALLEYERRSALLSSLDHRAQRASRNLEKQLQSRKTRAREEIRHAQLVSRRVRAARIIQSCARKKYGFSGMTFPKSNGSPSMTQNEAAVLIQSWAAWKERVASGRFLSCSSPTGCEDTSIERNGNEVSPKVATEKLVGIINEDKDGEVPSFEAVRAGMTRQCTLHAARTFLDCLNPTNQFIGLNDRALLSAFLIATHSAEVLGDDNDTGKCAKMLTKASRVLVSSIRSILNALHDYESSRITKKQGKNHLLTCIRSLCKSATSYCALFHVWKDADLANLVKGMTKSAEQSWLAYLSSSEALSYMAELINTSDAGDCKSNDCDPLMPLRLRHEASKSGSRSHIKRLRVSLNKLVGTEEGLRIVKGAKVSALRQMAEENAIAMIKQEVDECYKGTSESNTSSLLGSNESAVMMISSSSDSSEGGSGGSHSGEEDDGDFKEGTSNTQSQPSPDVSKDILSNEHLVHRILLTDPSDFDKLTWHGESGKEFVCDKKYMDDWLEGRTSPLAQSDGMNVEQLIADNMKRAFFNNIIHEMKDNRFESVQKLLLDLHSSIRNLIPNRPDLHSYLRDDDAGNADTTLKILRVLLAAADALANNLEAPSKASSTLHWIANASTLSQGAGSGSSNGDIPYGFKSKEDFLVASCAFLLSKAELCQLDIANFQLQRVAPLVRQMGHEYELRRFKGKHGIDDPSSIDMLRRMLPATNAWLMSMLVSAENQAEIERANSVEKRLAHVRTRGFVDGLLFTKSRLEVPEVLFLDSSRIQHIRDEARFAVIGCALGLHISNASEAGNAVFRQVPLSDGLEVKREELNSSLRAKYSNQDEFVMKVTNSAVSFAQALGGTNTESLRNSVAAVLRGDDPVLKLLSQRVKQFFRVCCKWKPITSPVPMRTGRSMLRGEESNSLQDRSIHHSSKEIFVTFARKEASKLGFTLFCDNLVKVGEMAHRVIDLSSKIYGKSILDRLLMTGA